MKALKLLALLLVLIKVGSAQTPVQDLYAACKVGDVAKVTAAISAGADVNHIESGQTPLVYAYFWPEVTKLLLNKGLTAILEIFRQWRCITQS